MSLRQLLDESRLREDEDADMSARLHETEGEREELQRRLIEAQERAQVGQTDTHIDPLVIGGGCQMC